MRTRLLQLRKELESIASTSDQSADVVELDQSKVGRLSRMDALQAQAMAKASVARREMMLARIDAALSRIDDDNFGFCLRCDEAINPKRLDLDPTATLCLACAEDAESNRHSPSR
jgi:DnaK suppressor protein